jgi:hypothetical protein
MPREKTAPSSPAPHSQCLVDHASDDDMGERGGRGLDGGGGIILPASSVTLLLFFNNEHYELSASKKRVGGKGGKGLPTSLEYFLGNGFGLLAPHG